MLLAAAANGWWRGRDRLGALFTLAGTATLMAYTVVTGFNYGWQKSIQFGAILVVAFMTAPLLDALFEDWPKSGWRRTFSGVCAPRHRDLLCRGNRGELPANQRLEQAKKLSRDWYELREALRRNALREQPVLVESASFRMPFFHSMWAAYFLDSSQDVLRTPRRRRRRLPAPRGAG